MEMFEFVKEMEPVDILIMSYFVHNTLFLTHAAGIRFFYKDDLIHRHIWYFTQGT